MPIPLLNFRPQQTSSLELEIIDLKALYKRAPKLDHDLFEPHRLSFYHFIYITKGSGSHFIDFNRYPYRKGSFILVGKNQVHAYDSSDSPEGQMILFTQEYMDLMNTNIRMPFYISNLMSLHAPVITVKDRLKDSCEAIVNEIDYELSGDECNNLIVQFLFSALLLKLSRKKPTSYYDESFTNQQAIKFSRFMKLVEENFSTTRDVLVYAQMMDITYKSLNQICKLACNQTPKKLIDAYSILEAKRRLVIEKVSINQLAYDLGFEEVTNFSKYFKKHTLLTPAQFKSNHIGK